MAYTWDTGMKEIERLLSLSRTILTNVTDTEHAVKIGRHYLHTAKDIWDQIKHLAPPKPPDAAKWIKAMKSSFEGLGSKPIPQNPVDIKTAQNFGKLKFFMADPTIIFTLSEWFEDYVVYKYGNDRIKREYEYEKAYREYIYFESYFGRGVQNVKTKEEYRLYRAKYLEG